METTTDRQNRLTRESDQPDRGYTSPRVNISETNEEYLLEVEMPGVTKEGLEVLVDGNELTIIVRRKSAPPTG